MGRGVWFLVLFFWLFKIIVVGFLCQAISMRCKINNFWGLFWDFPWARTVTFWFSQLFFNVLVFNVWFMKGEKRKRGDKRALTFEIPFRSLQLLGEGFATMGESVTTMATCLWLHLCDQMQQSASEHRFLVFAGQGPLCPPWLLQATADIHAELPAVWLGVWWVGAKTWNEPELRAVTL